MKRFICQCGNEIFFENTICTACQGALGFVPEQQAIVKLNGLKTHRPCEHRIDLDCNWLVDTQDPNPQCRACRLTRMIPNLSVNSNLQRWSKLEATKRRAFYMLLRLQLPIPARHSKSIGQYGLLFDFLEDKRSNRLSKLDMVYTGHANGIITINAAEADDSYRSAAQQKMKEAYRTLLGHFRHEMGHFYWMHLQNKPEDLKAFRQLFGDERQDYQIALRAFYRHGPRQGWSKNFISAYASAHPLEDWAECWAHFMHISETLETAATFGLTPTAPEDNCFSDSLSTWMRFSVALNALNRSMGVSDPYPFVINAGVERKLHFIADWIRAEH